MIWEVLGMLLGRRIDWLGCDRDEMLALLKRVDFLGRVTWGEAPGVYMTYQQLVFTHGRDSEASYLVSVNKGIGGMDAAVVCVVGALVEPRGSHRAGLL
jgi:hypothetical protein